LSKLFQRYLVLLLVAVLSVSMASVAFAGGGQEAPSWPAWELIDGQYRGSFDDREHIASVQLEIKDEEIVDVSLRWGTYRGIDYRAAEENPLAGIYQQYVESLEYLIGAKGQEEILERTRHMENQPTGPALEAIATQDVDGFSAATIRSGQLGSAVRDALNRGRYRPTR